MKLTTLAINQLRKDETKQLRAYYDVNGYAIGYGWHYYPNGKAVQQYDTITDSECETQFAQVLNQYSDKVKALLSVTLSDNQFSALVMYSYNRGVGAFRGSKLRSMVNANPKNSNIPQQFTIEWGTNTTYKSTLIARRSREAKIWQTPDLDSGNTVLYFFLIMIVGFVVYRMIKAKPTFTIPQTQSLALAT